MPIYNKLRGHPKPSKTALSLPQANYGGSSSHKTHPNSSTRSIFGRAAHHLDGFEMMGEDLSVMEEGPVTRIAKGPETKESMEALRESGVQGLPRTGIAVTTNIEQHVE